MKTGKRKRNKNIVEPGTLIILTCERDNIHLFEAYMWPLHFISF